jgi:Flp pilus assembly protein TadD
MPPRRKSRAGSSDQDLFARAITHHRSGDLRKAEDLYRRILAEHPDHGDALHLLGCAMLETNRQEEAVASIREAVRIGPGISLYRQNLTQALLKSGDFSGAATEAELALRLHAENSKVWSLLGLARMELRDHEAAIAAFSKSLSFDGTNPETMVNLAAALNRTGDFEMARDWVDLALRLSPENPLAWTNRGMSLKGLGRYGDAKEAFQRAGDLPIARVNLGYVHLLEGDFALGWPLYEKRREVFRTGQGRPEPEWRGELPNPGSRLLVIPEQGMGDTILMSRFFPALAGMFASVVVVVEAPLLRLMTHSFPGIEFTSSEPPDPLDAWCPIMSLPHLLRIMSADALPRAPYLRPATATTARGTRAAGSPLRAGINWAGNPSFTYDAIRSTRLETFAPLLEIQGIVWESLHKGHLQAEAERYRLPQPLGLARDFLDTANVLAGLDLIVSTETAVPNLSGAMGVRTIVVTTPDADWRWTGWYPSVTICRRESARDWEGAVTELRAMLQEATRQAA